MHQGCLLLQEVEVFAELRQQHNPFASMCCSDNAAVCPPFQTLVQMVYTTCGLGPRSAALAAAEWPSCEQTRKHHWSQWQMSHCQGLAVPCGGLQAKLVVSCTPANEGLSSDSPDAAGGPEPVA